MENSKANGQVERAIRTIKDVIRRQLIAHPTSYWSDHVPTATMMMQHTISRAHNLPPYTIVTGRSPVLPSHLPDTLPEFPLEPDPE